MPAPFAAFAADIAPHTGLRAAIDAAYRRSEPDCLPPLIAAATLPPAAADATRALAQNLITGLRQRKSANPVAALIQEFSLSSAEGIALMCLAEALLRIPDIATRDALIRDKLAGGNWQAHLGQNPSLFVNAATWGLVIAGRLTLVPSETSLRATLTRLAGRVSEPVIRRAVDLAMRLMGEQFVTGPTIAEALARARAMEAKGFTYSYDMLGEAAMTAADAARYAAAYQSAIDAIGHASNRRGILEGPGISIKLSALHPRYQRAQRARVRGELLPVLQTLADQARGYDIGINIDAEEADRLDLSLDLLEALCRAPSLVGWNGIGFVVQAYQKRAPFVIDWLVELARVTGHRLMVRLVKGAYWDSEIKRAQVDGLADFPVFTRKLHTDVSYLACAAKLLAAPDAVFPQFATHNAQTLANIVTMAGPDFTPGQYEFQCLHGMGEPLYEQLLAPAPLRRPCRIYAPVGGHETLLAYLVRRLLENGANSSFVNRVTDPAISLDELTADPALAAASASPVGAVNPLIKLPGALFSERPNSDGLDFSSETALASLLPELTKAARGMPLAAPVIDAVLQAPGPSAPVRNPADATDIVGSVQPADAAVLAAALTAGANHAADWAAIPITARAQSLRRTADLLEDQRGVLLNLLVREAGKTLPNAVGEVREAVDFLRYYAAQALRLPAAAQPLGVVACISPWNFPLAIFMGQIAAALVTGNVVIAKPAEETPLIAATAVRLMHEAGIPRHALQFLPGSAAVGADLVASPLVQGVVFTGSAVAARSIQSSLASRLSIRQTPIPLIAETGGINCMIVDSSALSEQVVADVMASAFDSAGQRCSALRILCLQEDIAAPILEMLQGAMAELRIGAPDQLATDIGPIISRRAHQNIADYVVSMRARGFKVTKAANLPAQFMAPTLIEISQISDVTIEIFGPILHVLRFRADHLDDLIAAINATGFGLTFGLHTRISDHIDRVSKTINAGNIYINRNIIGAVVGVQPFGGMGLSGTGPKAGGPSYLTRLCHGTPAAIENLPLPGPAGESNTLISRPRGAFAALSVSQTGLRAQLESLQQTGNLALLPRNHHPFDDIFSPIVTIDDDWFAHSNLAGVVSDGHGSELLRLTKMLSQRKGPILPVIVPDAGVYHRALLSHEICISINTAAAGGNATLLTIA